MFFTRFPSTVTIIKAEISLKHSPPQGHQIANVSKKIDQWKVISNIILVNQLQLITLSGTQFSNFLCPCQCEMHAGFIFVKVLKP